MIKISVSYFVIQTILLSKKKAVQLRMNADLLIKYYHNLKKKRKKIGFISFVLYNNFNSNIINLYTKIQIASHDFVALL